MNPIVRLWPITSAICSIDVSIPLFFFSDVLGKLLVEPLSSLHRVIE